jgi:uroporphyrinogen decarboxylase
MRIADVCVDYLVGQIKAGAQVSFSLACHPSLNLTLDVQLLQVFDSWAGELSPHDFALFSYPSLVHISSGVRKRVAAENLPSTPMTLFAKGANHALATLAESAGYDTLGLDWCIEPSNAITIVNGKVALQGNMDPNVLYGGRAAIENTVKRMCEQFQGSRGWIVNLGHGITPGVDPEDLRWFFECVHKYSAKKA